MPEHSREPEPIAHIHAPRFPHDPVEIVGNERGLERLVNALIDSLNGGEGGGTVRASDGYESELSVKCLKGDRRPEEWVRSGSPYWDIDDPLVARILDLTEENCRLRRALASSSCERVPATRVEYHGGCGASDEPLASG